MGSAGDAELMGYTGRKTSSLLIYMKKPMIKCIIDII